MTKVSIVILNWNGYKDTFECLQSLDRMRSAGCDISIIVVDNASTDGSYEKLNKLKLRHYPVEILRNKTNLGFAEGNNTGLRYALDKGSDYILVLNNDTLVDRNLMKEFIAVIEENDNVAALSPKIYFAPGFEFHKDRYGKRVIGKVIWSAGGKIDWNNVYGLTRGVDEIDRGQYDKVEQTEFATGACLFLRTDALRKVGIFDPKYFLYYEDTDLSVRLKKNKWKIMYVPGAVVWHKVSQSSGIGSELNDYYIARNRLLFGMKYASLRAKFALMRESIKFMFTGRKWLRIGAFDFYLNRFGKGSWK